MKFDLFNQTPLSALAESRPDKQGQPALLIIAKGVWRSDTSHLASAEAQIALRTEPLVRQIGELELDPVQKHILQDQLEQEIVWLDHEVSAPKGQFEIVIAANIREPHGQAAPYIDASVTLGEQVRMIRAYAPRYWHGNRIAQAGAGVRSVPMCHCFAHWQDSLLAQLRAPELPDLSAFVRQNATWPDWLPWLEDPQQPLVERAQAWHPWSFNAWPETAPHRLPFAGTYDDGWKQRRSPNLPHDFDPRFYNIGHPALQMAQAPRAGCPIRLRNIGPQPALAFQYPALNLQADYSGMDGVQRHTALRADTLLIEPEHKRFSIIWRAHVPLAAQAPGRRGAVRLYPQRNPA
ncbi:MAG: hypothetical protein RL748_671 [Pseudomonadota bacterium]|jgi:hypothetical protein